METNRRLPVKYIDRFSMALMEPAALVHDFLVVAPEHVPFVRSIVAVADQVGPAWNRRDYDAFEGGIRHLRALAGELKQLAGPKVWGQIALLPAFHRGVHRKLPSEGGDWIPQKALLTTAPTVRGYLVKPRDPAAPWLVRVWCPHCGEQHQHGAGLDGRIGDGHRVADCRNLPRNPGYVIEVVNQPTGEPDESLL